MKLKVNPKPPKGPQMNALKRLMDRAKAFWNYEIPPLSRACGGEITLGDVAVALAGFFAALFLTVSCGFLVAVVYN